MDTVPGFLRKIHRDIFEPNKNLVPDDPHFTLFDETMKVFRVQCVVFRIRLLVLKLYLEIHVEHVTHQFNIHPNSVWEGGNTQYSLLF